MWFVCVCGEWCVCVVSGVRMCEWCVSVVSGVCVSDRGECFVCARGV